MEFKLIRSLIVLGVPGVSFGVFFLLMRGFNFTFDAIPSVFSGIIATLFLLIVGAITAFALHRWSPLPKQPLADNRDHDAIASKLSEWTRLVYDVKTKWRKAMDEGLPWPGANENLVDKENSLYSELLASLNISNPAEQLFLADMKTFRDIEDMKYWAAQRDQLLQKLRPALKKVNTK